MSSEKLFTLIYQISHTKQRIKEFQHPAPPLYLRGPTKINKESEEAEKDKNVNSFNTGFYFLSLSSLMRQDAT